MPPAQMPPQPNVTTDQAPDEASASAGYCIDMEFRPDGTIIVTKEPLEEETGEQANATGSGAPGEASGAQPEAEPQGKEFTDVAEAFKYAAQIYQENPITGGEQDHMMAAYGGKPSTDQDMAPGYQG